MQRFDELSFWEIEEASAIVFNQTWDEKETEWDCWDYWSIVSSPGPRYTVLHGQDKIEFLLISLEGIRKSPVVLDLYKYRLLDDKYRRLLDERNRPKDFLHYGFYPALIEHALIPLSFLNYDIGPFCEDLKLEISESMRSEWVLRRKIDMGLLSTFLDGEYELPT